MFKTLADFDFWWGGGGGTGREGEEGGGGGVVKGEGRWTGAKYATYLHATRRCPICQRIL